MTPIEAASVVPYNGYGPWYAIGYFAGVQMYYLANYGGWTHDRRCALRWRDKALAEAALQAARRESR